MSDYYGDENCPQCGLPTFVEYGLVKDSTFREGALGGLKKLGKQVKYKNGSIVPESVAASLISHFVGLGMQHLLATATHFKRCKNCGHFSNLG
jgi:hypothetical protein